MLKYLLDIFIVHLNKKAVIVIFNIAKKWCFYTLRGSLYTCYCMVFCGELNNISSFMVYRIISSLLWSLSPYKYMLFFLFRHLFNILRIFTLKRTFLLWLTNSFFSMTWRSFIFSIKRFVWVDRIIDTCRWLNVISIIK